MSRFSYNNNITFNTNKEYNTSFGYNRSDFNLNQRANTKAMHLAIQNIHFSSIDFRLFDLKSFVSPNDFLYVDPPYLISDTLYNTKSRHTNSKWEM